MFVLYRPLFPSTCYSTDVGLEPDLIRMLVNVLLIAMLVILLVYSLVPLLAEKRSWASPVSMRWISTMRWGQIFLWNGCILINSRQCVEDFSSLMDFDYRWKGWRKRILNEYCTVALLSHAKASHHEYMSRCQSGSFYKKSGNFVIMPS